MTLVKAYFNYMSAPQDTLRQLVARPSFAQACAGYLVGALSWVLFWNIADGGSFLGLCFKTALVFAASLFIGGLLAAVGSLISRLLSVPADAPQLFVLIGTAGFITGLLVAFALISAMFPAAHLGWLAPLALLLVFGLQLGYLIRALHRIYAISYGRAISVWVLSLSVPCVAGALVGLFLIWGIILLIF